MPDWGISNASACQVETLYQGITSGSAGSYGSWVEVGTPTGPLNGFSIRDVYQATTSPETNQKFVDIAIGESGSQVSVISNLAFPQTAFETNRSQIQHEINIPIALPAGQKIWMRSKCSGASRVLYFYLRGLSLDPTVCYAGADSLLESELYSASNNWANSGVVAAAAKRYRGLLIGFRKSLSQTSGFPGKVALKMKRGAVGSEQEFFYWNSVTKAYVTETGLKNSVFSPAYIGPIAVDIPEGERFYFQGNYTRDSGSGDNYFTLSVHGFW